MAGIEKAGCEPAPRINPGAQGLDSGRVSPKNEVYTQGQEKPPSIIDGDQKAQESILANANVVLSEESLLRTRVRSTVEEKVTHRCPAKWCVIAGVCEPGHCRHRECGNLIECKSVSRFATEWSGPICGECWEAVLDEKRKEAVISRYLRKVGQ